MMPPASDGMLWIPETRLVKLAGVPRSSYQSWDREGLLARPPTGAYTEGDVVEAIVVASVRAHLPLATTRNVVRRLRDSDALSTVIDRARVVQPNDRLDLVVDITRGLATVCHDVESLVTAVSDRRAPRAVTVVPLAERLAEAVEGFRNHAERGQPPTKRSRGRPARQASVTHLRGA